MKPRELVTAAFMGALLYVQQVALAALPNIHLCAFLILMYALYFPRAAVFAVAVFVLLEGITYGFGLWWISYLYSWPLLLAVALLFRKNRSPVFWAAIAGGFGLLYGALCAIPYFFMGGPAAAISYWIYGIPFDLIHGISNVCIMLLLWKPMGKVFARLEKLIGRS